MNKNISISWVSSYNRLTQTACLYFKENPEGFIWCIPNASLGVNEWQSLFMGVLSLATSGHLAPAPLNQTNTKLEMPEHDNTNYTLQLV